MRAYSRVQETRSDGVAIPPPGDRGQAAAYVAGLVCDLAALARRHRLDTLGFLLDMARLEAENAMSEIVNSDRAR